MSPPEPADGTALYWRARSADELAFCIIRDDAAARLFRDGTASWFKPNVDRDPDPSTWAQVQYWLTEELLALDEAIELRIAPAVGQPHRVFKAGDPEPGPVTLAVRWLDDTDGNWIWHRLTGADGSGESDWVARGREGDGTLRRWSQICHGRNQVIDVTDEVTR